MSVAVIHPGTQHSWQTALALQELDNLEYYATSIFYQPERWPYRLEAIGPNFLRSRLHNEFRRFAHPALNPKLVRTSGVSEWVERVAARIGFRGLAKHIDRYGNQRFAASLRRSIASSESFAVWGYDNSSRDIFREAKPRGRTLILDRTNGDWRAYNAIMASVYDQYPEFFLDKDFRVANSRIAHNDEEFALADVILTGSPFAAKTITDSVTDGSIGARVRVLNYCYDELLFQNMPHPQPRPKNVPVRFLFVGQAGVRKGIHLILKTFSRIPKSAAEVKIVGDLQVPPSVFSKYADRVVYQPTVARADVPKLLAEADVLLFPSYFEGAGIVLYEALAAGTALIQSRNAAEAVTPNSGVLLPNLSEPDLYDAVMSAIDDRQRVSEWRINAHREAKQYAFSNYRAAVYDLVKELGVCS